MLQSWRKCSGRFAVPCFFVQGLYAFTNPNNIMICTFVDCVPEINERVFEQFVEKFVSSMIVSSNKGLKLDPVALEVFFTVPQEFIWSAQVWSLV